MPAIPNVTVAAVLPLQRILIKAQVLQCTSIQFFNGYSDLRSSSPIFVKNTLKVVGLLLNLRQKGNGNLQVWESYKDSRE